MRHAGFDTRIQKDQCIRRLQKRLDDIRVAALDDPTRIRLYKIQCFGHAFLKSATFLPSENANSSSESLTACSYFKSCDASALFPAPASPMRTVVNYFLLLTYSHRCPPFWFLRNYFSTVQGFMASIRSFWIFMPLAAIMRKAPAIRNTSGCSP